MSAKDQFPLRYYWPVFRPAADMVRVMSTCRDSSNLVADRFRPNCITLSELSQNCSRAG